MTTTTDDRPPALQRAIEKLPEGAPFTAGQILYAATLGEA